MKKILALLFALLMCLILVACDDNQKDDSNHSNASGEQHEHVFGEWAVATAATCTTDGTEERVCACGEKETKPIDATGHTFGEWAVATAATCTEEGAEERACACGEKETRAIDATGHTFGEWTVATAATCTAEGTEERACACGEKETRAIDATGHTFGEWTVATAATCTAEGTEERACACGEKETRAIDATGHTFGEWTVTTAPTCTVAGTEERVCSCGEKETKSIAVTNNHNYIGEITTEPTCTTDGVKTFTCSACEATYTESVPSGHKWDDATCTTPKTCSVCETTEGEALGHTTDSGTCTRCNAYIVKHVEPVIYSGTGDSVITGVTLVPGVAYYAEVVSSKTNTGSFYAKLYYGTKSYEYESLCIARGYYKGQVYLSEINIEGLTDGILNVETDGEWEIRFYPVGGTSTTNFSGSGSIVSGCFTATTGRCVVNVSHAGEGTFYAKLYKLGGKSYNYESLTIERGDYTGSVVVNLEVGATYFLAVESSGGTWKVDLGQGATETVYRSSDIKDMETDSGSNDGSNTDTPTNDVFTKLKNLAIEKGTSSSSGYICVLSKSYDSDGDLIARTLIYNPDTNTISFAVINGTLYLSIDIDEVDGSYSWMGTDTSTPYWMSGTIYGSTYNSNSKLSYSDHNLVSSLITPFVNVMSAMANYLFTPMTSDLASIGVTAADLGFVNY